jgi:hypothetical protein
MNVGAFYCQPCLEKLPNGCPRCNKTTPPNKMSENRQSREVAGSKLVRKGSFVECRACLAPASPTPCCGYFYCTDCFMSSAEGCPNCGKDSQRHLLKGRVSSSATKAQTRRGSMVECRLCLEPGKSLACCSNFYCEGCMKNNGGLCPKCKTRAGTAPPPPLPPSATTATASASTRILQRRGSLIECRLCLAPGSAVSCCGSFYCSECLEKNSGVCPKCKPAAGVIKNTPPLPLPPTVAIADTNSKSKMLQRRGSMVECRLCLAPGSAVSCCGNFYCGECLIKAGGVCPKCAKPAETDQATIMRRIPRRSTTVACSVEGCMEIHRYSDGHCHKV